jgi:hypothetical protein
VHVILTLLKVSEIIQKLLFHEFARHTIPFKHVSLLNLWLEKGSEWEGLIPDAREIVRRDIPREGRGIVVSQKRHHLNMIVSHQGKCLIAESAVSNESLISQYPRDPK